MIRAVTLISSWETQIGIEGRTLIIVSNRGPVTFEVKGGEAFSKRGSGGLVSAISSACLGAKAKWISSAMSSVDRELAKQSASIPFPPRAPAYELRLVDIPERIYEAYYNSISNPLIWFVFHYLWDLVEFPKLDRSIIEDWECGYLEANRLLAEAAIEEAILAEAPLIMLQDYHLFAAAKFIKKDLPDVPVMHFNHIPWPERGHFQVLPKEIQSGLLEGLLAADVLGFQTSEFAEAFLSCCSSCGDYQVDFRRSSIRVGDREILVKAYPISIDPTALFEAANDAEVSKHAERISKANRGLKLIVRCDRADPSKNVLRGFEAYDALLTEHPELKGEVVFLAFLYPTREKLREYADYRRRIEALVKEINDRHCNDGWLPISLRIKDNYPESLAALKLYDVLLVNPIRDGMNLVAKEGPLLNEKNGVLVLSERAGAHCELGAASLSINPFDVRETSRALYEALNMPKDQRTMRSEWLKQIVAKNDSNKWLRHQLADINRAGNADDDLAATLPTR